MIMKKQDKKRDVILDFHKELRKVKDNDRSLVIITHGFIELLINTIIDSRLIHGKKKITSNNRDYPVSVKLVILNELKILDKDLYKILDWFRKIRNKAAHDPFFSLDNNERGFYKKSLDRFIPGESQRPNRTLYDFCHFLVGTIWNENLDDMRVFFEFE